MRYFLSILITLLLLSESYFSLAQQTNASPQNINYTNKEVYQELMDKAWKQRNDNPDTVMKLLKIIEPFIKKFPTSPQTPRYYYVQYCCFSNQDEEKKADSVILIAEESGKKYNPSIYSRATMSKASYLYAQGYLNIVIQKCFSIINSMSEYRLNYEDSSVLARAYGHLGLCYANLSNKPLAFVYIDKMKPFLKSYKDSTQYYQFKINIYQTDFFNPDCVAPQELLDSALSLATRHKNNEAIFVTLSQFAQNYFLLGRHKEQMIVTKEMLNITTSQQSQLFFSTRSKGYLGYAYLGLRNYSKAIETFRGIYGDFINNPDNHAALTDLLRMMAESFKGAKQYDSAYYYEHQRNLLTDSLFSKQKKTAAEEMAIQYDIDQKDKQIAVSEASNKVQKIFLNRLIILLVVLILLLGYTVFGYLKFKRLSRRIEEKNYKIEVQANILQKNNRLKDKLFTILAHDLRSPINAYQEMASSISYLLKNKRFQEINELSMQIDITGQKLNLMLGNLLNWSLMQQSVNITKVKEINFATLAHETVSYYTEVAQNKGINLKKDVTGQPLLYADPNHLSLVLRNLVDNALKFSTPGSTISLEAFETPDSISIKICNPCSDDCKEKLPVIQELFASAEEWQPGEKEMGIGLIMIKHFIKLMRGTLNVEMCGKNLCFQISIPTNKK